MITLTYETKDISDYMREYSHDITVKKEDMSEATIDEILHMVKAFLRAMGYVESLVDSRISIEDF